MNPFHTAIALLPVSVYLLALSGIHFGRRPVVITGARDTLALSLACLGFVIVGPMQLFIPDDGVVAMFLGPWVWVPMISLYALCVMLAALLMRPRLVIYNLSVNELRPRLESIARELDAQAVWAGSSLQMATLGVQLTIESWSGMKIIQLVSAGPDQDLVGWKRFERRLRADLMQLSVGPNARAGSCLFFSLLLVAIVVITALQQPQEIADGIDQLLDRW